MARAKKEAALTPEERLQAALVPDWEWPHKLPENWCWTTVGAINQYVGISADPTKAKNETFELYSVPSSADNYPEIVLGADIGSTKQAVKKGDVLLCKINPRINRVWKVSKYTDHSLLASSEWIVVRNSRLISNYLMWCFRSPYFRGYMLSNVSGVGGSLMRAQPKFVQGYPVPVPPLAEQQRIVDRIESLFAKLDEAKEKAQAVVDSFETRKAAILHKALTGELTAKWREEHYATDNTVLMDIKNYSSSWSAKEKDLLSREQAKSEVVVLDNGHEWIRCTIGAVGRVTNGSTPLRKEPKYWSGKIPWISSGEVRNNIIESSNECISEEGYANSSVKLLPIGTVLIAMIGEGKTRGQSAILNIEATINQNIAAIVVEHNCVLPYYIWYWLQMNYAKNREKGSGSGPQALNCQRVRELDFFVPNLKEQKEVVNILRKALAKEQQSKEAAEAVLDQIDLMKKSILARAFRGELGTNDPSEESAVELLRQVIEQEDGDVIRPKAKAKRIAIPAEIKPLLSGANEEAIVKLLLNAAPQSVSTQTVMSISKKKFELMDALRNLEKKQIVSKSDSGEYSLVR